MVRRNKQKGINKRGIVLILLIVAIPAFLLSDYSPFEAYVLGDYTADIYYTSASYAAGDLYLRGDAAQPSMVIMDNPESLILQTEPISAEIGDLVDVTRTDLGYSQIHFSMGNARSVTESGIAVDYDSSIVSEQRTESSWKINTYTLRMGILVSTMLDSETYSGKMTGGPIDVEFENGFKVPLTHWYRTAEMNSVSITFVIVIDGGESTKEANIKGINPVLSSLDQYVLVDSRDAAGVIHSYKIPYDDFIGSTVFPTDNPKLPTSGPSVQKIIVESVDDKITTMEVTVTWGVLAPGVSYHSVIDEFSIYNVVSILDMDIEIDIYANTYDDAKFNLQDIPIIQLPRFSTTYDWLSQNTMLVLIVFGGTLSIGIITLYVMSRRYGYWVGE